MADSSFLTHGRTRVQRSEGVEIIVTIRNERNLASLTIYGDVEGHETSDTNSSSNEIYITAGVVSIYFDFSWVRRLCFLSIEGQSLLETRRSQKSSIPC